MTSVARPRKLPGPFLNEQVKRLEKSGDWNRYEVRCTGPRIQLFLNGEKTVDYTETEQALSQSGLIGLQIHGNAKSEAAYRNISIRELPDGKPQ